MTRGQIAQLQELSKCHCLRRFDVLCIEDWLAPEYAHDKMQPVAKAWLRRLWHQYRNQVKAMRKNRQR